MVKSAYRYTVDQEIARFLSWVNNAGSSSPKEPIKPEVVMVCMNRGLIDVRVEGRAIYFGLSEAGRTTLKEMIQLFPEAESVL